jgi:Domain of unknown function (DUF3327)
MTPAIAALAAGPKTREAVEAFMAANTFPIVSGSSCTFVWRGEAEAVHLKHWVFGLPSSQQLARIEGTDVWHLTLQLPPRSRVEYKLEVVRNGRGEWLQDPLNKARARDPFGANSVAQATGYAVPSTRTRSGAAASGSTSRPGFSAAGPIRCSSCTTATTTCATRRCRRSSTT